MILVYHSRREPEHRPGAEVLPRVACKRVVKTMKDYPRLTEMGVLHPDQIDRYSVNSIDYTDVLRIVYVRPKGSVLPETRTYKFPRVQRSRSVVSGTSEQNVVMESDPCFTEALDELAALMANKNQRVDVATTILEELRQLEEEASHRIASIRDQLKRIQDS